MSAIQHFDSVSDKALIGQFTALVKQDQRATADLLSYLDAIDRRQLWAKPGYWVESLKKRAAMTGNPRTQSTPRGQSMQSSRAIPPQLKREVWERDDGRCDFVGEEGRRCNETRGLEYAHLHPWGKGGQHSHDNLGLRCRAHNAYEASRDYGEEFMQEKRRARQRVHHVKEAGRSYQADEPRTRLRDNAAIESRHRRAWVLDRVCWSSD